MAIIYQIPTETLLQIFRTIQLDNRIENHILDDQLDSTQILFCLSRVCRLWRKIIWGCPTLWSDICLNIGRIDTGDVSRVKRQATGRLERAGGVLLSLTILFPYEYDEERWTGEESAEILPVQLANIFRDTMSRWKSFRMHAHPIEIQSFLDSCTGPTPNLSRIIIKLRDIDLGGIPRTLFIPFQRPGGVDSGSPVVARFTSILPIYSSLGTSVTELRVNVSDGRLRTIDLITMLLSCPNLIEFSVIGEPKSSMTGDIPNPVVVPLLHLVQLHLWRIRDPEHLLGALRLQALQSLTIYWVHWSPAMQDALQRISQTCTSLISLDIDGDASDTTQDAPDFLAWESPTFPSVERFKLQSDHLINLCLRRSALSLPQAQEFALGVVPLDIAYHLLSSSTQLKSLSLYSVNADVVPRDAPIITLPHLLSINAGIYFGYLILSYITAPNLSELLIDDRCVLSMDVIRDLIARSNPPLRKLRLYGEGLADADVLWCLQRLPLLEELEIAGTEMSDATLRALEAPPPSEQGDVPDILLPQLRSATIGQGHTFNEHITTQGFAALTTSRLTVDWKLAFNTGEIRAWRAE
ncbi:hypothetical protein BOTBODRAFT_172671 [Botryobasidium botryosum FD-172 SS1]|uniref:F-box domain-containing protein n=1 Tax=Botryobasidium botryosum (strain FD-172 SS1) TaxID=930990 RepID=A0A067MQU6_BOTB1|nr:hypothetical protein BOTBODRAFT_172671 [Botryobasidium botryosum FD-172 SS1]